MFLIYSAAVIVLPRLADSLIAAAVSRSNNVSGTNIDFRFIGLSFKIINRDNPPGTGIVVLVVNARAGFEPAISRL